MIKPPLLLNCEFMRSVSVRAHWDVRLADPSSSSYFIFLVARPGRGVETPAGSLNHWSFYSQGHFYHLSAPGLGRDTVGRSQNASKSQGASCKLKHEDWSHLDPGEWRRRQEVGRHKPLMAWEIGQTDYKPFQILQMASWVVDKLPRYNLFDANCQHFVVAMMDRTVMRLSDRTVFMGLKTQIVD